MIITDKTAGGGKQRCIQSVSLRPGMHSFPFGRIDYGTKGPIGRKKKNRMYIYANYERQEKHANDAFQKEIEHPISHNREMIEFLKFQVSCYFRIFVVEYFHFVTIMSSFRSSVLNSHVL